MAFYSRSAATAMTIKLRSSDDQVFDVEESDVKLSVTIRTMLEGESDGTPIQIPNVTGSILAKIIEYCKHHKDDVVPTEEVLESQRFREITGWDAEFVKVDQVMLFDLILGAKFLDIKPMLDLTCKSVAAMIKGKTPEEISQQFNIKNDFTPAEEEQVRKENAWCEDK